jgi:CheY-like chemotaxis protein
VTSVSKGSEAVARAKQMGADVVLVDAELAAGEPSGYDVCQALKADPATASTPVILLVSNQKAADHGRLKAVGGDGWLAKPFDSQELIDKVREVAGKPAAKPTAAAASVAASRPAPSAAARPAAAPASQPAARPAASTPAPRPAATQPAAKPAVKIAPTPATTRPASPAASPRSAAPAQPTTGGEIPIAIPIPFTSADNPTPGILARLRQAGDGSAAASLDPKVAQAILSLSREVVEAVVWEVVPELAEQIIKDRAPRSA